MGEDDRHLNFRVSVLCRPKGMAQYCIVTTYRHYGATLVYKQTADSWIVFDTSGKLPVILDKSEKVL